MLLKELNYILAIEKYGTITKAAEHLYISQPALSKYIKTREETLDTNLLENTGRSIILTDAGKHYAKAARKMMEIYETMSRNLLNSDNMIHGTLRIGTSFTRSPLLLPETLARFRQKYPNVELLLFEENSYNLETQLASGLIDFVIAKGPVTNIYKFTALPLFREEFLLGLPKDHPVKERAVRSGDAAHPWLGLQEVLNECFILLKPGHHTRFMADQFFAQSQFVPAKTIVTANIETALRMAVAGLGIVFVLRALDAHNMIGMSIHPGRVALNFGVLAGEALLLLAEPPLYGLWTGLLTAAIILFNFAGVWAMARMLLPKLLGRRGRALVSTVDNWIKK